MQSFRNETELISFVRGVENESKARFITLDVDSNYSKEDWQPLSVNRVYWEWAGGSGKPAVKFSGTPFMFIGYKTLGCHQGKDRAVAQKKKYAEEKAKKMMQDHSFPTKRSMFQNTKKVGCPAAIYITKIATFPEFKVNDNRERCRKRGSMMLRKALERDPIVWESLYIVANKSDHAGHHMGEMEASVCEPVDPRVEQKVSELAKQGVRKLSEVKRHLCNYVTTELFRSASPPPLCSRRYFPSDKDLRNIMSRARQKTSHSKIDQVNLEVLFQKWSAAAPDDKFHLRKCTEETTFLLCYQAAWQMRLLCLYGNEICLFDATYKTTRYALPLFFICVRTNVGYIVVGVMVVQEETAEAIKEGLEIFKSWNTNWKPAHFMVDFSHAEIKAVESVFEGTRALLCDFHREKAWGEWVRKQSHMVANIEDALAHLRAIAKAESVEEYNVKVKALTETQNWRNNQAFRNWFSETWLSEAKRWVYVFKTQALNIPITTNNGIERQNETFKYKYLEGYKNSTLSEMLEIVITKYIPDLHRKYIEVNVRSSSAYRRYNEDVPRFLHNRPSDIVRHVMSRMDGSLSERHVSPLSDGFFLVKSEIQEGKAYIVHFGTEEIFPSCQCSDWKKYKLPCKHFCAIFKHIPGWSWYQMSSRYIEHPLLNLDSMYQCSSTQVSVNIPSQTSTCVEEQTGATDALPPRKLARKTQLRKKCVSLTKELADKLYRTENQQVLEEVSETLSHLLTKLGPLTENEEGMPLNVSDTKRMRVSAGPTFTSKLLKKSNGRRKMKYSGRVGAHAEKMREAHKVFLKEEQTWAKL